MYKSMKRKSTYLMILVYIYIHTHTHTHTHIYIYIYIHTYVYIYIYIYIRTYIYIYTHTHTHIYTYIYIYSYVRIYIYIFIRTYIYICITYTVPCWVILFWNFFCVLLLVKSIWTVQFLFLFVGENNFRHSLAPMVWYWHAYSSRFP